jgi:predicted MFS family arabinose efflux permease
MVRNGLTVAIIAGVPLGALVCTVAGTFTVYTYPDVLLAAIAGLGLQALPLRYPVSAWRVQSAPGSAVARRTGGARA